jgi:hypothetical protein
MPCKQALMMTETNATLLELFQAAAAFPRRRASSSNPMMEDAMGGGEDIALHRR